MNVAYIGNFKPAHSTENHYAASFRALGHSVLDLQEDELPTSVIGTLRGNAIELLLYTRTWNCLSPEWAAAIADPPEGVTSAAVHLDIWWGLERQHEVGDHVMFDAQHVFTADGGHDQEWREAGVNHHWLRPGVVELGLVGERLGTPDFGRWPFDVAFVGSRSYHREWPRAALIDGLRAQYGDRFVHVGGDGDLPPDEHGHRTLRGQQLNDFYATVPVIVGDSLGAHAGARYWSDRFYETWGRGGFLVSPQIDALTDEVGWYPSYTTHHPARELYEAVDHALALPAWREERRAELGAFVRSHCTYTQRAAELLETLCAAGALCGEQAA